MTVLHLKKRMTHKEDNNINIPAVESEHRIHKILQCVLHYLPRLSVRRDVAPDTQPHFVITGLTESQHRKNI